MIRQRSHQSPKRVVGDRGKPRTRSRRARSCHHRTRRAGVGLPNCSLRYQGPAHAWRDRAPTSADRRCEYGDTGATTRGWAPDPRISGSGWSTPPSTQAKPIRPAPPCPARSSGWALHLDPVGQPRTRDGGSTAYGHSPTVSSEASPMTAGARSLADIRTHGV